MIIDKFTQGDFTLYLEKLETRNIKNKFKTNVTLILEIYAEINNCTMLVDILNYKKYKNEFEQKGLLDKSLIDEWKKLLKTY